MISSVVFDTADRIDAEISSVLAAWPDETAFNAREALEINEHLCAHSRAIVSFALEEFATRLQNDEQPDAAEFAAQFPEVQSELEARLRNLLSMELAGNLLSDAPEIDWPRPGQRIGNFHLVEQLGIGAFSRVFMAFDTMMGNRSVVVKVTKRPADECQLAGPLNHPNLAKLFSVTVDPATGLTVVCMPYFGRLTCDDLRSISPFVRHVENRQNPNDNSPPVQFIETTLRIMAAVGDGVGHLHSHGIIHRDIKPSNIVLNNQMFPTLVDFNASTAFANSGGIVVGTLPYVAPEILDGIRAGGLSAEAVAPTADIYSLGLVCYEMLGGALPFEISLGGGATVDSLRRSQLTAWTPLRERNPLISRRLADIIRRATAPTADKRFETAEEFCRALRGELRPLRRLECRVRCSPKTTKTVALAGSFMLAAAVALPFREAMMGDPVKTSVADSKSPNAGIAVDTDAKPRPAPSPAVRPLSDLNPATRTDEINVYASLTAKGKPPHVRVTECVELEASLSAAEKRGQLSPATYNNWGFILLYLSRVDDALQKLRHASERLPNNEVVLSNRVTCEFLKCSGNHDVIPDNKPFRHLLDVAAGRDFHDYTTLGMGAFCIWTTALRDRSLTDAAHNEMVAEATQLAKRAILNGISPKLSSRFTELISPAEMLELLENSTPKPSAPIPVLNPLAPN